MTPRTPQKKSVFAGVENLPRSNEALDDLASLVKLNDDEMMSLLLYHMKNEYVFLLYPKMVKIHSSLKKKTTASRSRTIFFQSVRHLPKNLGTFRNE
jgi:hypothetical protein